MVPYLLTNITHQTRPWRTSEVGGGHKLTGKCVLLVAEWNVYLLLCRALEFFCAFTSLLVSEYRKGSLDDSLLTAVYMAYDQSLKQHHNWFMRGTFYVSIFRY